MHIPDGFLAPPVWAALDATAIPAVGYFVRRTQRSFEQSRIPLLGVLGAFVFAAQMINFPIWGGTSGHLVGGALLALTLGPHAAVVVMTAILAVQALVFQDGGVLALGANVLNMAVVGVWAGYLPAKWLRRRGISQRVAAFAAGWLSLMAGAFCASLQLWFSDVAPATPLFASMLGIHALTGLAEGAITAACLAAMERLNPEFVIANGAGIAQNAGKAVTEPLARRAATSGQ
jgi:cobalt/nickel transport system permease protein